MLEFNEFLVSIILNSSLQEVSYHSIKKSKELIGSTYYQVRWQKVQYMWWNWYFFSTVDYIWTQLYLQDELEKLNKHTEEINKLELQLEDANCLFRTLLTDSTQQLKALSQKVGKKMTLRYAKEVYMMFF